jgi:hypothetical protein
MKISKVFIAATVIGLFVGKVFAGVTYPVPAADTAQQADVNYGGVDYSTSAFNVRHVTAAVTPCIFYGVQFSSGSISALDFVDVWDSTSVAGTLGTLTTVPQRIYNVIGSTTTGPGANLNGAGTGFIGPRFPVRMKYGIVWRPSVATYNSIFLYLYKPFED